MKRSNLFVLLNLVSYVLMSSTTWAGFCVTVEGEADTTLTVDDYKGAASLSIDGNSRVVDFSGINLGFTETEEDGTQHAVTSTDWKIRGSRVKFTSFEDARLDPTDTSGVFLYVGRSRIETGNKRFNCGEMVLKGEVDFINGVGSFPEIRGKLCRCK